MFNASGLEEISIRLGLDEGALRRALRGLSELEGAIDEVGESVDALGERSQDAGTRLTRAVRSASDDTMQAVDEVRQELNQTRLTRLRRGLAAAGGRVVRYASERDLLGLQQMRFMAYGSPLLNLANAAQSLKSMGDEARTLEQYLGDAQNTVMQFGSALMQLGLSAGVALAAASALTAALIAFEMHAQNVRRQFNAIIKKMEEEIEIRTRLAEMERSDPLELQQRIREQNEQRRIVLEAGRKVIIESLRSEAAQHRAERVNLLEEQAYQMASKALEAGQIKREEFEKFKDDMRRAIVDALSESELVSLLLDMKSETMGFLGTGAGGMGDPTEGAKAAGAVIDRLVEANREIAIAMNAMKSAVERMERIRTIEGARRRLSVELEMREMGATGDRESLERERRQIAAQIANLQTLLAEYQKMDQQHQEVAEAIRQTNDELAQLQERQEALERVAAPLIEAREAETKRMEAQQREIENLVAALDAEADARRQARTMSSEQLAERRREIMDEISATEHAIRKLKMQGESNKAAQEAIAEYNKKLESLRAETERLTRVTEPLIRQREREADLQERFENRNRALIEAVMRFDDDVRQIEEDTYKERAAIQQRYNERLVQIAQDAAKEAADAFKRLQEQLSDIRNEYLEGETSARQAYNERLVEQRVQFERDEVKAYEDHAKRLEGILRDAQRREEDLILARDFAALFQARRDTSYALQDANREFNEQRAERAREFAVRLSDEAAQFEKERQQRAVEYAKRLAEAQAQYQKERQLAEQRRIEALNEARVARDRERQELEIGYQRQLEARRQLLQRELADIADFGRRKAELERAALERGLQMIGAAIDRFTQQQIGKMNAEIARMQAAANAAAEAARRAAHQQLPAPRPPLPATRGGGSVRYYAGGGMIYKGDIALVNEPGSSRREGFNNVPFPPVSGLFLPLKDGMINGNVARAPSAGNHVALTFNVTGAADPALTAEAIRKIVVRTMRDVLV